ncbi:alpha/beta hydrolase [Virgibacillus halodenitrificans]|uniref:alpha/beta hydrolase n=1 Tax=Virgibacillus halodenitrificans TaxID=1482 RepID=UPI001FB2F754|nr:alpha/beta hydrolase [Virgibacillus halodenitrificans]MCJ0932657.1 alpha/beta hydrolase [Virgibacillus halodenitrificans]
MEQTFWVTMKDGVEVFVRKWYKSNTQPRAAIQLSHGMVEHIGRYHDFAEYLVNQGYVVYGNDHRGHGYTGEKQGRMGYFAEKNGFAKTADDLYQITEMIKDEFPSIPVFLFGHSMGSFLVRYYLQKYSEIISGVILLGTGYFPTAQSIAGKQLANLLPPKQESKLMNSLAFGTYNKKIKDQNTSFDWLSGDETAIQNYIDDPYTGFIPTARFFYDLMDGLIHIHDRKFNKSIRADIPMLILSGDADPVGNYSKGIWKTAHLYEAVGLKNIVTMLFTDGRHELLNERNKEVVYGAIVNWINQCMK